MSVEKSSQRKFEELSIPEQARYIIEERTPSPEQVIYSPTVEFLDPKGELSREERAKVVAMGDRTAISYKELGKKVINDRDSADKTSSFFQMYALAARSSKEIAHTSILEQLSPGPETFGGDPPIVLEGISVLAGLRDVCRQRYGAFEAFSSRGGIFPEGYYRVPDEILKTKIGPEISAINKKIYDVYLDLTREGLEEYLKITPKKEGEKSWEYRWRVLNLALDDSRQITNGSFLNHLAYHPNSALALRETIADLSASDLPETVEIADRLRKLAFAGLPNIMQYTEASPYSAALNEKRRAINTQGMKSFHKNMRGIETESKFDSAKVTPEAEKVFLATFLSKGKDISYSEAFKMVNLLTARDIDNALSVIFEGIGLHDKPPKELESVKITAEMSISLGGMYELIRHRGMLHTFGNLTPNNGFTMPEIYKKSNVHTHNAYKYAVALNERAYDLINNLGPSYSAFAEYFVARAHIQKITISMDALEVFHFLKIRASDAAHPDIRKPAYGLENFLRNNSGQIFKYLVKK